MRIREWTSAEIADGDLTLQWLVGVFGCFITTLPVFVLGPIWFCFSWNYRIETDNGSLALPISFLINLCAGVVMWVAALSLSR